MQPIRVGAEAFAIFSKHAAGPFDMPDKLKRDIAVLYSIPHSYNGVPEKFQLTRDDSRKTLHLADGLDVVTFTRGNYWIKWDWIGDGVRATNDPKVMSLVDSFEHVDGLDCEVMPMQLLGYILYWVNSRGRENVEANFEKFVFDKAIQTEQGKRWVDEFFALSAGQSYVLTYGPDDAESRFSDESSMSE